MAARARMSHATPGPSTQSRQSTVARLPDYQPPQFAMSTSAQQQLAALHRAHDFTKLHQSLGTAITIITESVTEINERLADRRDRIARQKPRKRKATSQEPEDDGEEEEQHAEVQQNLQKFSDKVEAMTKRMDDSIRKMIDGQEGLAFTKEALPAAAYDAHQNASTQASIQARQSQMQAQGQEGDEEDETMQDDNAERQEPEYPDITPTDPAGATQTVTGPSKFYKSKVAAWKQQYESRSLPDRYCEQNDYKNFRRLLHGAQDPNETVPMPHPGTWFGEGVLIRPGDAQRGQVDDGEDIQISRATTSTKCPITLQELKQPLTSKKCAHTFEGEAIRDMILKSTRRLEGRLVVSCPATSCSSVLEISDLYMDIPITRRIRRLQQREDENMPDAGDNADATVIEDDDDEAEDAGFDIDDIEADNEVPSTKPVKSEAGGSRRR